MKFITTRVNPWVATKTMALLGALALASSGATALNLASEGISAALDNHIEKCLTAAWLARDTPQSGPYYESVIKDLSVADYDLWGCPDGYLAWFQSHATLSDQLFP